MSFPTDGDNVSLPLPQTPLQVIEGANSSPFFFRPSISTIPEQRSMLTTALSGKDADFSTGFGVVLTPFAKNVPSLPIPNAQQPIHRVDRRSGIPRCSACRGYVNSFTSFSNYGRSFTCNLCGAVNEVPDWYQSPLDVNGRPLDIAAKPELQFGSYEAVVDSQQFNMKESSVGEEAGFRADPGVFVLGGRVGERGVFGAGAGDDRRAESGDAAAGGEGRAELGGHCHGGCADALLVLVAGPRAADRHGRL